MPAAQGLLLTTSFYWDMDDKTREWSKRYFAKMNRMPTMWQAGVYSSVMYYLNAIKETGTDEPLKVAAKMREKPIEDFFARNGKLREDGLMVHDLMLVQVKTPDELKYPWDYYKILAKISGEEASGLPTGVFAGKEVTDFRVPGAMRHSSCRFAEPGPRFLALCTTGARLAAHHAVKNGALRCVRGDNLYFTTPISRKYFSTPGWINSELRRGGDRVGGRGLASLRQFLAQRAFGAVQRFRQTISDIVGQIGPASGQSSTIPAN